MSLYRIRVNAFDASVTLGGLLVMSWLGLHGSTWPDWIGEARPAVDALVAGHVLHFLQLAPAYGGSLILRAPFVMLPKLWHGGQLAIYRAGAAPCLAATGALGFWLAVRMRARGSSAFARAVAVVLCVANPLTLPALQIGHPEELLGAALCIAALLCARDDRPVWAAVLLGLAIANKEWAVLATGPVLLALPRARVRAALITGAVAGTVLAPLLVGGGGFVAQASAAGLNAGAIFQPWQIWWFLGSHGHAVTGSADAAQAAYRVAPGWVGRLGHPLVIAVMPPLTALYALVRRAKVRRAPNDLLLLLALLLALRCVLDPWDISYYSLPFLLTLLTWEALSFTRPPVLSLAASLAAWLIFRETSSIALALSLDAQAMVFTIVSLPAIAALAATLYAPGLRQLLVPRPGHERRGALGGIVMFGGAHARAGLARARHPASPLRAPPASSGCLARMRVTDEAACGLVIPTGPADSAAAPKE
jgi:hypothetical protein